MFASTGEGGAEAVSHAAGWFLEHAWLIPLIPAVAFAVIILLASPRHWPQRMTAVCISGNPRSTLQHVLDRG